MYGVDNKMKRYGHGELLDLRVQRNLKDLDNDEMAIVLGQS